MSTTSQHVDRGTHAMTQFGKKAKSDHDDAVAHEKNLKPKDI